MKNKTHTLLLVLCAVAAITGCASMTPKQLAGKSLSSAAISVDSAMKGWAEWVNVQRANPNADQDQLLRNEGKVRTAFDNYVASQVIAKELYLTAVNNPTMGFALFETALTVLKKNEQALLNLITNLSK